MVDEPIILRNSKWRAVMYGLLSSVFVAVGIWMVTTDHSQKAQIVGWLNFAFFGAGLAVFVCQLFDNRPRITITAEGIEDRTLKMGVIEWSDILGARVVRISRPAFIGLELVDENKYLSRLPGWSAKLAEANEAIGFSRVNLNLAGLSVNPDKLAADILQRALKSRELR